MTTPQTSTTSNSATGNPETFVDQAKHLAQDTLAYAQSTISATQAKATQIVESGLHEAEGISIPNSEKSLADLINDGRNLAAGALGKAGQYVQSTAAVAEKKTEEATQGTTPGSQSYIDQARSAVSSALASAQSAIATGQAQAEPAVQQATAAAQEGLAQASDLAQHTANKTAETVNAAAKDASSVASS